MSAALLIARTISRRYGVLAPLLLVAGLLFAYLATLAPGPTWANNGTDSGDLITAAATLGVAHPTGYPTYLLLARLFQLLPLGGDLATRTTLLSAVAAAVAAFLVYATVRRLLPAQGGHGALAASVAGVAFGVAPALWSQAVVAEEYTLNALAATVLLYGMARMGAEPRFPSGWRGRAMGLAAGLALGNHLTIAALVGAWLMIVAIRAPRALRRGLLARQCLWIAVGSLVYLYLPLSARGAPPVNWGDPHDWAGFWWVVSGRLYHGLAFGLPLNYLPLRLTAWAGLLVQQFGFVGVALGITGALYRPVGSEWFVYMSGAGALLFSVFAIGYDTVNSYAYLLPAYGIFAIWLGLGIAAALRATARWRAAPALIGAALLFLILWPVPTTIAQIDASHDYRAMEYAQRVLRSAPPDAIIITNDDQDTFPLWYYHYAEGQRPDIALIVAPLLEFPWYRANLRSIYPDLAIPDSTMVTFSGGAPVCRVDASAHPPLRCD